MGSVLTNSTEQSSSCETTRFSYTQEILGILRNVKVHYLVHKSPQLVPVLGYINLLKPTGYVMHQQFNIQQL